MKKSILTFTLIITLIASAFAGDDKTRTEVTKAFASKFATAREVTWVTGSTYYRAYFNYNGTWMYAYYNMKAELIGMSRNILSTQLPFYLQENLKNERKGFWITNLMEFSDEDGFRYYVTLQDADKTLFLVSENGSDWSTKN